MSVVVAYGRITVMVHTTIGNIAHSVTRWNPYLNELYRYHQTETSPQLTEIPQNSSQKKNEPNPRNDCRYQRPNFEDPYSSQPLSKGDYHLTVPINSKLYNMSHFNNVFEIIELHR